MAEREALAAGELKGAVATFEMRRLLGIESLKGEIVDAGEVMPAGVVTRSNLQDSAGLEIAQSGFERIGIADGDVRSMSTGDKGEDDDEVAHGGGTLETRGAWVVRQKLQTVRWISRPSSMTKNTAANF